MKFTSLMRLSGLLGVVLVAGTSAMAATVSVPITDLYNTGMSTPWNAAQVPLPGSDPGSVGDPNWVVYHDPAGALPYGQYATETLVDGAPPFTANQFSRIQLDLAADPNKADSNLDSSQWIRSVAPSSNGSQVYVFETTFTTSVPTTTISISGFFKAADVLGVQLNGGAIEDQGNPHGAVGERGPLAPSRAFSVTGTGGLTNTLRFYVQQVSSNPSYFRAQFTNATFTIPEPSTIVLGALGLVGFGATRLRRRFSGAAKAS